MRISLHGAAGGEVTGSGYLVETNTVRVLVDFGLFQGSPESERLNKLPREILPNQLDAVVLTHGHLDHTGRLPLLTKAGYRGPIYTTPATIELTELILRDSAHLQEADVNRINRRLARQGKPLLEPLYLAQHVDGVKPLCKSVKYDTPTTVASGISVRLVDAGHMLGSASIEMTVEENGSRRVIVFSGDLGPRGAPVLNDPVPFQKADLVFLESTYGDRDHRSLAETMRETRDIVAAAVAAKGKILVPAFAIGRTQMLLYLLAGAFSRKSLPRFPIYVDSPMAIEATKIYGRHPELFDEEALAMQSSGELKANLSTVKFCPTADDSRALNAVSGPCLIMAGAGMCNGGRILHHLRHNLAQPSTHVLIVGYQAVGSLGRMLVDGKKSVRIFGEQIPVRASVHTLGGFSAHAGRTELLGWFGSVAPSRPRVVLTHGENNARQALARGIKENFGLRAELPGLSDTIEV